MKIRTYLARGAALALILSPALVVAATTAQEPRTSACACSGNTAAVQAPAPKAAGDFPEPSEEVKRIWTSP